MAAGLKQLPILGRRFYSRATDKVARELLGKILVHELDGGLLAGRIVETEAYLGRDDQAAHSFRGTTPRTEVIFGPPGHAYVYLIYGMYRCLNLIAERDGVPGCVLIRAMEPLAGVEEMFRRRPKARRGSELASGPGKLTAAMGITLEHYGLDVTRGPLTVRADTGTAAVEVATGPRVGISKSRELPLRFSIRDNEHVSG
jgi:DNA-3-methyladenine glycosylase